MNSSLPAKESSRDGILRYLLSHAENSAWHLLFLNFFLGHLIPFNRAHGIRVKELSASGVQVLLPYRRSNFNHLQGLHACSLATAAEFASGLALVRCIGFSQYRLIMREISAVYLKQGRIDALARCECPREWVHDHVIVPLGKAEEVDVILAPKLFAKDGTLLAEVTVKWQIKRWSAVKGK